MSVIDPFEAALPVPVVSDASPLAVASEDLFESTTTGYLVRPQVEQELFNLREQGIDADVIDVEPTYSLTPAVQREVDRQSEAIGQLPRHKKGDVPSAADTLFDPTVHSAGARWSDLSKRAIALRALTEAGSELPHAIAPGIDPAIYDEPLFDGRSANEVVAAKYPNNPGRAQLISNRYRTITTTMLEDDVYTGQQEDSLYLKFIKEHDFSFLASRDFLTGVVDSRAVDTRAIAATQMALEHVLENPKLSQDGPLVTASLACGAAAPMFELNQRFADAGVEVGKNILVDNDAMALASAVSLGRHYGMEDKVDARFQDIIATPLTDYIEPHSVHVLDILGIVDYLPTSKLGYKAAANFIGKIREVMSPGGIIVAGNALASRPHQAFFDKVWPVLEQRDPAEMIDIVTAAGYDPRSVQVRVPQREGVYGIYGIKIPMEIEKKFAESRLQRAARRLLTVASKFNKY